MICSSCRRTLLSRLRPLPPTLQHQPHNPIRSITTVPSTPNAAPTQPPPPSKDTKPQQTSNTTPAISSSAPPASQPFSTPVFPGANAVATKLSSSSNAGTTSPATSVSGAPAQQLTKSKPKITGSIIGGAELKGLAYIKTQPQVLAKEDDEYPAWLWGLLGDSSKGAVGGVPAVDLASMTKKQRLKHDRKQAKLMQNLAKPIPIHEQSQDLTTPSTQRSRISPSSPQINLEADGNSSSNNMNIQGGSGEAGGDDAFVSFQRRAEITKSAREARRKGIRESNFLKSM